MITCEYLNKTVVNVKKKIKNRWSSDIKDI